jgi:hypothetical protein
MVEIAPLTPALSPGGEGEREQIFKPFKISVRLDSEQIFMIFKN